MKNIWLVKIFGILLSLLVVQQSQAAITLDRTRIVFNGAEKSVSMSISNENQQQPYLAQGWIENEAGEKITTPFTVLPPLQRLDPGAKSQVKVQSLPAVSSLPQDRESLFYFNLREIPPKNDQPNVLQLAMQIRVKMFYRPAELAKVEDLQTQMERLTLTRQGDQYQLNNPTSYFVTVIEGSTHPKSKEIKNFASLMLAPKSNAPLPGSITEWGASPVLTYINDYGGRVQLQFTCTGATCTAKQVAITD